MVRQRTLELAASEYLEKFAWTYNGRNVVTTVVSSFLNVSFFILAGTSSQDIHTSLDEFEFRPDPITDYGVSFH